MSAINYDSYAGLKGWGAAEFGAFNSGENSFYAAEVGRPLAGGARLLEIGFGNGSLLGWAAAQGYIVSGYEIQPELKRRAEASGVDVIQDLAALKPDLYDIIVAFDVFEHLQTAELSSLIAQIQVALKPGGKLIARFPNGDSPFSMPTFNGDLTHLTWIGNGKVEMLMEEAGFRDYELRAPKEAFGLVGWLKHIPKALVRGIHRLFVKFAYLGGAAPSTFHLNYFLVAIKPSS